MDRERITISIKKSVLDRIDETIDGTNIRNRSHAFETLALQGLGTKETEEVIILLGGDNAMKHIPAVEKYLTELKLSGFNKVRIATGFLGDKVKERLGNGDKYDLTLKYSSDGEGSGGSLLHMKKELKHTFVVINSFDGLEVDLKKLLKFHRAHGAVATVATDDLDSLNGIYVFEPSVFENIPKGFSMIEEDIIPSLAEAEKVVVYPLV